MIRVLVPLGVLCNGIAAGVMLSTVIGIVPLTFALPYDSYVRTIQFLWPRYDPLMPIMNVTTFGLDAVLAIWGGQRARALFGIAAVLLLAVMVISVVKNVPINKYVAALDPQQAPRGWAALDPRPRWRAWNLARTGLALLALAANVAAAGMLL